MPYSWEMNVVPDDTMEFAIDAMLAASRVYRNTQKERGERRCRREELRLMLNRAILTLADHRSPCLTAP